MTSPPLIAGSTEAEPRWVVLRGYKFPAYRFHNETEKTVQFVDNAWGNNRIARRDKKDVLFVGSEAAARRLSEQLTSSAALYGQEQQAAQDRRIKRDDDLIAKARGE